VNIKRFVWGGVGVLGAGALVVFWVTGLCLTCATDTPETSLEPATVTQRATQTSVPTGTSIGARLPNVRFNALDGTPVRLEQLPKKPTVLYFSAVWCASCRYEVKELTELKGQWGEKVSVVYVDTAPQTDTPQDIKNFAQDFGYPDFLWTLDNQQAPAIIPLKVLGLGTVYVMDAERVVAFRGRYSIGTDEFKKTVQSLLGTTGS